MRNSMLKFTQFFDNKLKEEQMTSSGGDVRGLGNVSGSPGGTLSNYVASVVADSDQRSNELFKTTKEMHSDLHFQLPPKDKSKK